MKKVFSLFILLLLASSCSKQSNVNTVKEPVLSPETSISKSVPPVVPEKNNKNECFNLKKSQDTDDCLLAMAIKTKNESICNEIRDTVNKKICPVSVKYGGQQVKLELNITKFDAKPGDVFEIKAKIVNATKNVVNLNGILEGKVDSFFAYDFNPFFQFKSKIEPGESVEGVILNFAIGQTAPSQIFSTSVSIQGGADASAQDLLGIENFVVNVK